MLEFLSLLQQDVISRGHFSQSRMRRREEKKKKAAAMIATATVHAKSSNIGDEAPPPPFPLPASLQDEYEEDEESPV